MTAQALIAWVVAFIILISNPWVFAICAAILAAWWITEGRFQ